MLTCLFGFRLSNRTIRGFLKLLLFIYFGKANSERERGKLLTLNSRLEEDLLFVRREADDVMVSKKKKKKKKKEEKKRRRKRKRKRKKEKGRGRRKKEEEEEEAKEKEEEEEKKKKEEKEEDLFQVLCPCSSISLLQKRNTILEKKQLTLQTSLAEVRRENVFFLKEK